MTIATADLKIPGYYEQAKAIVANQIVGHRTVSEYKLWDWAKPELTEPVTFGRSVAVHGNDLWVLRDSFPPPQGNGKDLLVRVVSPDAYYYLELKPSGKYVVGEHGTEWKKPEGYGRTVNHFPAAMQLYQPVRVKEVVETADDKLEGRRTRRITVRTGDGVTRITHVDRKTGQHLYSETDKVLDLNARGYVPGKRVRRTEYREEGGRLWPTREEEHQIGADGRKQMVSETTFLEYAPYTPTADELDIGKQFGVKPIPHEPRPESAIPRPVPAGGTGAWLYAAAGILAVAAVAVVVARRRRRPAATS
ncbi:MAG: hypothetical protein K2X82_26560 [Gemmataceae bacterium]|nr:hypothetical protein [Gemmataceae bacterium]